MHRFNTKPESNLPQAYAVPIKWRLSFDSPILIGGASGAKFPKPRKWFSLYHTSGHLPPKGSNINTMSPSFLFTLSELRARKLYMQQSASWKYSWITLRVASIASKLSDSSFAIEVNTRRSIKPCCFWPLLYNALIQRFVQPFFLQLQLLVRRLSVMRRPLAFG